MEVSSEDSEEQEDSSSEITGPEGRCEMGRGALEVGREELGAGVLSASNFQ
jgi:hypothetical protein